MSRLLPILLLIQCFHLLSGETATEVTRLDEKLAELEGEMASSSAREITFKEERIFPFRTKAVELEGVLRLWNQAGISIAYPESRTVMILDEKGLLMRRISEKGSIRERRSGGEDDGMLRLLKAAFEFNRDVLEKLFVLKLIEDQQTWSIVMVPVDQDESKIEQVTIRGRDLSIDRIELVFAGKKTIRIFPLEETEKSGFSEEAQRLYFRSPDI